MENVWRLTSGMVIFLTEHRKLHTQLKVFAHTNQ